jgi:3-phenylpropionate/trans-cinnamate dioxygenase ferredoxin subunit
MAELGRIEADKVPSGGCVRLDGGPDGVCLVRIGDDFYAISDRCSHADYSLSEGEVDAEERSIECWKHGSAFSLIDGQPQSLPATQPVPVYLVRREGDEVIVTDGDDKP